MEKAIEIKRRAQRYILNGDLDGALSEYEKLIASGDSDPYHSVLLADLLFKKGDHDNASRRYLEAVDGYERMSLYKNAIAVCKKMSRLGLTPELVLYRLAGLHALDGLATESTLYYMQHAELLLQRRDLVRAIDSLRRAFQVCPDNVKALERLGETQDEAGSVEEAANTLLDAASHYERLGQLHDAKRCQARARELMPELADSFDQRPPAAIPPPLASSSAPPALAMKARPPAAAATTPPPPAAPVSPAARPSASTPHDPRELDLSTPATPMNPPLLDLNGSETGTVAEPDHTDEWEAFSAAQSILRPIPEAEPTEDPYSTPSRPSLTFDAPAAEAGSAMAGTPGLSEISDLLNEAQELFDRGERDAAGASLVRAAQAYDRLGRFESGASIYRSLSRVNEAPLEVMMLWLKNCERRDDLAEAARVACDLGDRAIMEGDSSAARQWFERAHAFDDSNELASRRLERLQGHGSGTVATASIVEPAEASPMPFTPPAFPAAPASTPVQSAPVPPASSVPAPRTPAPAPAPPRPVAAAPPVSPLVPPACDDPGLIEIALQRDDSIGMDLGQLIAEFQAGLDEQLASDPQGHYDLAMSYCEMGLLDEAIESFRLAAASPVLRVRSTEMVGRCYLDRGDFDEAARQFETAIRLPEVDPRTLPDLVFQLGLALEVGGHLEDALARFEGIYAEQPNYPDVAIKIRALRKALERD